MESPDGRKNAESDNEINEVIYNDLMSSINKVWKDFDSRDGIVTLEQF